MKSRIIAMAAALVGVIAFAGVQGISDPGRGDAAFPGANGKIAFISDHDQPGNWDIYDVNPDGTGVARLTTDPGDDFDPAWSPDGSKIAFRCNGQICVMNADGGGRTVVTTSGGQPAWSPDGTKIAFTDAYDILVINTDSAAVTSLTNGPEFEYSPAWSPDGSKIAFIVAGGNGGIYTMNADGSGRAVVFESPGSESDPTWSPDGTEIAFNSGSSSIGIVNADGSGLGHLLNTGGINGGLDWSPDGSKFVFGDFGGSGSLWLINADDATGVSMIKLTDYSGGYDPSPSWQPLLPATPTPTPTASPATQTELTSSVAAGAGEIEVASMDGFNVGDLIIINPGGSNEETRQITAFGSFILDSPLQFDHEAGEPVVLGSSGTPTPTPTPTATGESVVWGDHNCSGSADPVDSLLTLRHDAGLSANTGACPDFGQVVEVAGASPHPWGDVDCGGDVTPVDSLKLLRFDAGLSVSQAADCPLLGAEVTVVE